MKSRASMLCAGLLWISSAAWAADLYVDNQIGDDHNNGLTPEMRGALFGPMRTISRALKAAGAGDTIIVANTGQPYRECLTLQGAKHSTDGVRPFRIVGNNAVLDGTVPVDADAWEFAQGTVFHFKPHLLSYQQLYLGSKPAERKRLTSLDELDQLEPLQWALVKGRIYFCAEKDRLPQSYDLSYCGHPVGITLYAVQGVQIQDLTVQGFQLDGISAHDNVFDTQVSGSILRGNGRSGAHVGGACRVKLEACLIGSNATAQVHCSDYCRVAIDQCDVIDSDPAAPPIKTADSPRISIDGSDYTETN